MFLTIGDKIKCARKKYELKQIAFEPYGFSRNYISMIETNKRSLNEEALLDLYTAICELTNLEFQKDYSYESFCQTEVQQAEKWLIEQLNSEEIVKSYLSILGLAFQYKLTHIIISIESKMGDFYQTQCDYIQASYHYFKAISYYNEIDERAARLYEQTGINLFKLGKYKEAICHFELALKGVEESNPFIYKLSYDMALGYLYDNEYEKSLYWVEKAMNQEQDHQTKALAYLIKETALKKLGDPAGGRKVLLEFIETSLSPAYLSTAWHHLGCNYNECQLYDEALEALNLALYYPHDELGGALIEGVIGNIYFKLGNLDQSLLIFNQTKATVLKSGNPSQRLVFLEWGISLYWNLNQFDSIIHLLQEANDLTIQNKISKNSYSELQNQLYRMILHHMMLNPEDEINYRHLLEIVM